MPKKVFSEFGVIHLLPLLLLFAVLAIAGVLLLSKTNLNTKVDEAIRPFGVSLTKTKSEIPLKAEYKNPLDLASQYVNPFASYKNPFDTIK